MSMHLNHLIALERTGGAVWRRYCQLRDQNGMPGSSAARELNAFCTLWQEHPARLKLECERMEAEATVKQDDAQLRWGSGVSDEEKVKALEAIKQAVEEDAAKLEADPDAEIQYH